MSSPHIKRILADLRYIKKERLDNGEKNIWVKIDEDNIEKVYAIIKGNEDTPYKGGFYLFELTFNNTYPHKPPNVKFCTLDPRVRFNPNLYKEGKVCLSLLGTWSGPGWTACHTLASILLSIQSMVLTSTPLENEPGFENAIKKEQLKYNYVIEYFNYEIAVIGMLNSLPGKFKMFNEEIMDEFLKNKDKYVKNVHELKKRIDVEYVDLYPKYKSHNYMHSGVYNMELNPDFEILIAKMNSINGEQVSNSTNVDDYDYERNMIIYLRSNVNKTTTVSYIKNIATKLDLSIHKSSKSTGKLIKKTKKELLDDIDNKIGQ
jgi:ubiquitin-conjugating enzyme E2 Z